MSEIAALKARPVFVIKLRVFVSRGMSQALLPRTFVIQTTLALCHARERPDLYTNRRPLRSSLFSSSLSLSLSSLLRFGRCVLSGNAFRFSGLLNRFQLSKLHRNRCRCPRFPPRRHKPTPVDTGRVCGVVSSVPVPFARAKKNFRCDETVYRFQFQSWRNLTKIVMLIINTECVQQLDLHP